MDTNSIVTIISTVGFPIFACCALGGGFFQINKDHQEETKELRGTIEKNTEALVKLTTIIDERLEG